MNYPVRIVLLVLLMLVVAGLIRLSQYAGDQDPAADETGVAWQSETECRECHVVVWNEWQQSFHSRAWSHVNVQAAFQHFGFDRKCESCHAAQPVLQSGLERAPELRPQRRESGVDCLTCHTPACGEGVAAGRAGNNAPCRPIFVPELSDSRLCGACHTAIYGDWRESRYAIEGRGCRDCHMPAAIGSNGGRRSHLCLGGHDEATVRSGVRMNCRRAGAELIVAVTNHATGHNFPGERHQRLLLVQTILRDSSGRITLARQELLKGVTPFRGETKGDKIRPDETMETRFPIVESSSTADVRLLYKLFPWVSDHEALVVHREEFKLGRQ